MFWKKDDSEEEKQEDEFELVLLKTITNNYELELIKNLLEDVDIPYIIRDYGVGGYMRVIAGGSMFRTDILVANSMYEQAKQIIDELPWSEESEN